MWRRRRCDVMKFPVKVLVVVIVVVAVVVFVSNHENCDRLPAAQR